MTRLAFLSPHEADVEPVSPARATAEPAYTDVSGLGKLEVRGAAPPGALPIGPGRSLYVIDGDVRPERDRLVRAGSRVYDQTAALAAFEISGEDLLRRLTELDPEAARTIHPNDVRRTVRALELRERTGTSASRLRAAHHFADRPFEVLYLVLDPGRAELDARIDARAEAMIEAGLLQECRALAARGYGSELRSLQAIGYRHLMQVVEGRDTLATALEAMRRDTRRFARRQRTWFRAVPGAHWLHPRQHERIDALVADFATRRRASGASYGSLLGG